ncbi:MAG: hypothetical protein LC650_05440 [Actinobacteria bacterium]|nr:hypothetical protein [Actinomycetota bacterium]
MLPTVKTAKHKYAYELTDQELDAIIDGSDTATQLIPSPAQREALDKMTDQGLYEFIDLADKALANHYGGGL